MPGIKFYSNICIWSVWIEIIYVPKQSTTFIQPIFTILKLLNSIMCRSPTSYFHSIWKKNVDNLGKISIASSRRHSTALIFMTLSFSVLLYGDFIYQGSPKSIEKYAKYRYKFIYGLK